MKPLALNLKNAKKTHADEHSSTFSLPSGHQIRILHQPLSALQRKQIQMMPIHKMADGGDLGLDNSGAVPNGVLVAQNEKDPNAIDYGNTPSVTPEQAKKIATLESLPGGKNLAMIGAEEESAQQPDRTTTKSSADTTVNQSPIISDRGSEPTDEPPLASGNFQQAYIQGQQAIQQQEKIDEALSKSNADIQSKDILDRQSLNKDANDSLATFMKDQKDLMNDYKNNQINPNHYVENMSTGQKIGTTIGLLLGGIASGTLGYNPAQQALNQQIERDIQAQESRLGQQKTLLGANQELYKDEVLARNQTRINMNDIYNHKIQLAATKLGTQQAQQAAAAASSHFAIQNNQLLQQNAIRSAVLGRLQSGGAGIQATDLSMAGFIPQEEAIKEQASIDSQKKALASAAEIFKQYDQEQTAGNLLNPQSYSRVDALNAQATNLVMESDASKRLTPESAKLEVKPFWVKTPDDASTRASKLRGIGNLIRQHAAPTPYMQQYAPQSLPKYDQTINPMEGKTASNGRGQRIIMRNGQWVPYGG